jgi:hypothetical protein
MGESKMPHTYYECNDKFYASSCPRGYQFHRWKWDTLQLNMKRISSEFEGKKKKRAAGFK